MVTLEIVSSIIQWARHWLERPNAEQAESQPSSWERIQEEINCFILQSNLPDGHLLSLNWSSQDQQW